jgi:large subunit ribosomal protein L24
MNKIRKGDMVKVLAGKDKGKTGTVLQVIKVIKGKFVKFAVVVEGINIVKRHVRGNPDQNKPGGIIPKETRIDASNVALIDPTTNKPAKVGFKELDGKKVRYFKASGEVCHGQ